MAWLTEDYVLKSTQPRRYVLASRAWLRLECRHAFRDEICQKCGQHGYNLWVKQKRDDWIRNR